MAAAAPKVIGPLRMLVKPRSFSAATPFWMPNCSELKETANSPVLGLKPTNQRASGVLEEVGSAGLANGAAPKAASDSLRRITEVVLRFACRAGESQPGVANATPVARAA